MALLRTVEVKRKNMQIQSKFLSVCATIIVLLRLIISKFLLYSKSGYFDILWIKSHSPID